MCCVDREDLTYNTGEFGIYTIDVTVTDGADNQTQRLSSTLKVPLLILHVSWSCTMCLINFPCLPNVCMCRTRHLPSLPIQLTINVSDVNDNFPTFPVPSYSVSINETSPPNSMVTTVIAEDLDFGVNSVVDYELTGSSELHV